MKIVIDIDEDTYNRYNEFVLLEESCGFPNYGHLYEIIGKGVPLPKCKECKYFEYDSVAKVDGIPLIVAHEICNKWGNGCKTREDGYCFLFEEDK